uniref:CFAP65 fourth Ig-like domain-containing protein n=1 Tax=Kryptolebias marmoratus TaxID=37003 RepID=A0A3Q3B1B6_KRYMA
MPLNKKDCIFPLGPRVSLSPCVLDFGCGKEGQSVVQTVELLNSSPAQAIYQWDIDCENSVFSIQPASGTLLPHSRIKLKAVYKPTHPMAHYRRVACLILHRDPLFLDLIGTCHSESQQPEILKPEHLVLYKHHYYHRQNSLDSASQQDQNTHLNQQRAHSSKEEVILVEYLLEKKDSVTNTIFLLVWTAAQDSSFSVTPTSCDLAPLKSTAFQVTYNPKQLNTLHGGQLECFAYHKVIYSIFNISVSLSYYILNYLFVCLSSLMNPPRARLSLSRGVHPLCPDLHSY